MTVRGVVLILLVLCCIGTAGDDHPRITFINAPHYVSDRDTITIQVRIDPRPEHRLFVLLAVDGDLEVSRHEEQLDGDQASRTRWVRWKLPPGEWTLVAAVIGAQQHVLAVVQTPITVISSRPE